MEAANTPEFETPSTPTKKSNLREAKRRQIQEDVLCSLGDGLSVTKVCCNAGISRSTYYDWVDNDPAFARQVEHTHDTRASFIDMVLWHAACRAIGDPRYIRAATAYLQIHEQREKRRDQQKRWEAEQKRWEAEQARWQAEHARWQAEQKQQKEAAPVQAPEKPKRARLTRRRRTPPRPPKWVRVLAGEATPAADTPRPQARQDTATPAVPPDPLPAP